PSDTGRSGPRRGRSVPSLCRLQAAGAGASDAAREERDEPDQRDDRGNPDQGVHGREADAEERYSENGKYHEKQHWFQSPPSFPPAKVDYEEKTGEPGWELRLQRVEHEDGVALLGL